MTTIQSPDQRAFERIQTGIAELLVAIRSSFIYFVWAVGSLMFVSGVILQDGVMAAMLTIWGISAIIYGVLGFLGLRLIGYT